MGLFSSDYQNELFIPFVFDFVENGGNTYEKYYVANITNAFPYPIGMLLIESVGAILIKLFNVTSVFWTNFLFKLPGFVLDIVGYYILSRKYKDKKRYISVFYYASPIILYSVYMHGQLDIIPTILLMIALFCLAEKKKNEKYFVYGILFSIISLLCKLHILAIMPIIFFYVERKSGWKKGIIYGVSVAGGVLAGFLPTLSQGFYRNVLANTEQSVLTHVFFDFGTVQMYIPIVAVFVIYLLSFKLSCMNRELFLNLCGIVFSAFLALCPPMPGWYVWIVPFIAIFFAESSVERYKNATIYAILNILYLIYFVFLHNRELVDLYFVALDCSFLKINNVKASNVVFTLMSGTLLYLMFSMYQIGVASNGLYKRRNLPFTIGIAGDSGVGKTTMLGVIERCLGKKNLLYIEGDGDHRWERENKNWDEYTALNPKANYLYRQSEDLIQLRMGGSTRRVDYNHDTGRFTASRKIKPKKYVVLCGLHSMYLPQTRKNLDLKIYMDSDEILRRYWKIKRDTFYRGHNKQDVIWAIEGRMSDAEKYIYPQKAYADLVVRYYDKNLHDYMVDNHEVKLSLQLFMSTAVNVEQLVNELRKEGIEIYYDYSDDIKQQVINLDADNLSSTTLSISDIAEKVIPQIEEISRENFDTDISSTDGVIMLFILLLISNKMQEIT